MGDGGRAPPLAVAQAKRRWSHHGVAPILMNIHVQVLTLRFQLSATRDVYCRPLATSYRARNFLLHFFSADVSPV
jgi:hypothetical protein